MDDSDWLTTKFEVARPHLRAVAYRMLGSYPEADDAVQDAWIRLDRAEPADVENLTGWLTTVVARVCLDRLRLRQSRPEVAAGVAQLDPPVDETSDDPDPEQQVLLADTVGSALLIVLDWLKPAERVSFVLHDVFAVPFDEIAPIVNRSPQAVRQLASRARRRVQGVSADHTLQLDRQRQIVDAFVAASRNGDFHALMALLDPDAIFQADATGVRLGAPAQAHGAQAVAHAASGRAFGAEPGLVDGSTALVWAPRGEPHAVFWFTIAQGRIAAINMIADADRIRDLDIELLTPRSFTDR